MKKNTFYSIIISLIFVIAVFGKSVPFSGITTTQLTSSDKTTLDNEFNKFGLRTDSINSDLISIQSSHSFISKWNTTLLSSGSSVSNQISLPLEFGGNYDFTVDWGDSQSDQITTYDQAEVTHDYASEGVYTVTISGTLDGWRFDNSGDKLKIIEISQWGDFKPGNNGDYFEGCENLNLTATDAPDLSDTTTLDYAFAYSENLGSTGSMNSWNVSGITDFNNMFYRAISFNQSVENWNVSSATNMYQMFYDNDYFNQDISNWNTSSVTNMASMFERAASFNYSLNNWDVSSVTNLNRMFSLASSFNQPLNNWDISSVTNIANMFYGTPFNQPLDNWNTSSVTEMSYLFFSTPFNHSIGNWDTSKVQYMHYMFYRASSFNQPIGNWNVSQVETFTSMFEGATYFNQDISSWDTSSASTTQSMFTDAVNFNQPIGSWNVSNVNRMPWMFSGATNFNQSLNSWDTSSVTDFSYMFQYCSNFNTPLDSWNTSSVTSMKYMFDSASKFNQSIESWDVSNVETMQAMFLWAEDFNQPINNWNVSSVTNMRLMFGQAHEFNQSLDMWDTSSVTTMAVMFSHANSFNQPIESWNTSSVTTFWSMFRDADSFNQPLNSWDTSSVTSMKDMFAFTPLFNQPLNEWNTSNVVDMQGMFWGARSFNQPLGNWDTSSVENMFYMFYDAIDFDQSLAGWNITSILDMDAFLMGDGSLSTYNYDETLISWSTQSLQNSVILAAGNSMYSENAANERQYIIDTFGWTISDGGLLEDNGTPNLDSPSNITYEEGDTGNTITWNAGDKNPGYYDVLLNGSLFTSSTWTNGSIVIDIDGLTVDIYNFTIIVYDQLENYNSDTVIVTVEPRPDLSPPEIDSPSDTSYIVGTTGNTIEWSVGDKNPDNYDVLLNGSLFTSSTWTNGSIIVDIDGLSVGEYNFTIVVYDQYGNYVRDTVMVRVDPDDNTVPDLSSPSDTSYIVGTTGNTIEWMAGDKNPGYYDVLLNGSLFTSSTWTNGSIVVDIDGLSVGDYNFTIMVYDQNGNYVIDTLIVSVDPVPDTVIPDLSSPDDVTYDEGTTGHSLVWGVGDQNPGVYNVTLDGNLFLSTQSWTNGSIGITIDGLSVGQHTLIIYVYDSEGNYASDTVIITVNEVTSSENGDEDDDEQGEDEDNNGFLSLTNIFTILVMLVSLTLIPRIHNKQHR